MKSFRVIFLILFLLVKHFGVAQENYEIRKITFHGNHTLSDATLLEGMNLKAVSGLGKLFSNKEASLYTPENMKTAMERLNLTYQSEGFLHMQSTLRPPDINQKKQTVRLTIDIKEGKPVLVDTVIIQTTEPIERINLDSLNRKIFRKLELTKKKRFRDLAIRLDVGTIEDGFKRHGYAYVKVNFDLKLILRKT
jgi:outer membrane protein insertion porin family